MPSFLFTAPLPGPAEDMLRQAGDVEIGNGFTAEDLKEAAHSGRYDVLITQLSDKVTADVLNGSKLKGVANFGVGFNNIDVEAATANGIFVGNTPDVLSDASANVAMLLLLAAARRAHEGEELVRSGQFKGLTPELLLGADITGTRLGIAGLGRIGKAMARRALGFGLEVVFVQRPPRDRPVNDDELGDLAGRIKQVSWDELLVTSDHISLHVPLTPDTTHLIGAEELGRMKSTAVLVNTARGPVIDEAALVTALREGTIAAAGLDVYENEPALAPGLADLPNTFLLPHIGSAEFGTRARMGEMCAENAIAMAKGEVPPYPVNPEAAR
ncbi:D-glycerate dehydrogenase [Kocuria sp. JC486]|uniref:2-hydroxyacid dehydrogenase n=1 Tax=Kocuria sp. JC486 TaxID=1970736 RepID=UPI0014216B32|nr:D-glycerate dehydrogenase [Kocuria sp. JC486]NHU85588.1 D-glycerate dehydrogenase [Kocuria sp. JC486]